jgi:ABC-type transport system involved in cytochrome c biogenesis ATPase subunit
MRELIRVEVHGLLGRFSHTIDFPADWPFVILHGPNGIGKTRVLEILTATFGGQYGRLSALPFARASLTFSDGSTLAVMREELSQASLPGIEEEGEGRVRSVRLELSQSAGAGVAHGTWAMRASDDIPRSTTRLLETEFQVERVGRDRWRDFHYEDIATTAQLVDRYGDFIGIKSSGIERVELDDEVSDFVDSLQSHLIETQRLLVEHAPAPRHRVRGPRHRSTVMQYSDDVTRRLREALASNSRQSQQLDRTFPRRVIEESLPDEASTERIRERYTAQSDLRQRLEDIAILDAAADVPLPDRDLEDWERRVLWTYLDDTDAKLSTFQPLLDRLDLLTSIVNDKFLFKNLTIDREIGFRFDADHGGDIPASQLSSGEQHEVVLLYELLFNVKPGALVLIDEPEISLHVSWQQSFLADIERVAALSSLRFIIATHSPQIIHDRWSNTVALHHEV